MRHVAVAALVAAAIAVTSPGPAGAATLPTGFQENVVVSGLTNPTAVRFAPDGRVFVAEQRGVIKVFDSLTDTTPTVFADLNTNVYNFWDRGLMGLALDPNFPASPYVYVSYAYDADIGGTAPKWGTPGVYSDPCPAAFGATNDGCVVSGRLSRLQAAGNVMTGPEQVLIEDWCQQYPSHSLGAIAFGADGALYVSGGDGASFTFTDYGQDGNPPNPCGDPPGGVGAALSPPTAEGGALRSQDLRTSADPAGLNGSVLRVDPQTGAGLPDNPLAFSADANARRIVAHGFRNPFRITVRPGTSDVWVADVGWNSWEEIDRIPNPADAVVENFGWPCYEGPDRQGGYDGANLNICENLYAAGGAAVSGPFYTYSHGERVVAGESCPTGTSSPSGVAFYEAGAYPTAYLGALVFADYSRNCLWAILPGADQLPNAANRITFVAGAANPVDVQTGPGGDIFYVDYGGGTIRRITYTSNNQPPTAAIAANPSSGPVPLTVTFDGTGSSDADGDALSYSWDLNGDGTYGDSTSAQPSHTFTQAGRHTVRLRVVDSRGASDIELTTINAGGAPTATIATPSAGTTWKVGDVVDFSGSATDPEDGTLPASGLTWTLILHHCPDNCHEHVVQTFDGVASGSFSAPDHDYPSHLELRLKATDSSGLSDTESVLLQPQSVALTFESSPSGLQIVVGSSTSTTPFTRTVIVGSANSVSAVSPQTLNGTSYVFSSWSDGGAQSHNIVAGATPTTYAATFTAPDAPPPGLVAAYSFDEGQGTTVADSSGTGNGGTISGAAWTASGRYGSGLSFDGANDWVTVADSASLDLIGAMTLEAWVQPTALGTVWRTVVFKERTDNHVYALYANEDTTRPLGEAAISTSVRQARGPAALPLNTWTHLAATYDGAALRLFVDGTQVASTPVTGSIITSTGVLHIGGNAVWVEWFQGLIDELRIYHRALTAAEIQADMSRPVGAPDTQAPSTPSTLTASGGLGQASLSWGASIDNVGVRHYNVHRSTTSGFTPSSTNRIAQPSGTGHTDSGLAAGTYYYLVTAEDAAGNVSPPSNEAAATVTADTEAPTVSITAPADGATVSNSITVTASAADNVAVAKVQFRLDGQNLGLADTTAPYEIPWDTRQASNGSHTLDAVATDTSGKPRTSTPVVVTVSNTTQIPAGLVAAYGFEEGQGTTVADSSGRGNGGTISGAVWTTAGRYGRALSFDGVNDWVTVVDSASLDITRMTLSAWLRPAALGTVWRTVVFKERTGNHVYALYANQGTSRPIGEATIAGTVRGATGLSQLPLNSWTHLAVTYDGTALRLFVNGTQVASSARTGSISTSTGVLHIGGNAVWTEWFQGPIDEVRVYNRALTAAEIQADMGRPVP